MADPILAKSESRLTILPIRHPDLWDMYKKALASFWTAEEVQAALAAGKDRADFDRLRPEERRFLERVLAFFAAADGIVIENCARRFLDEVQVAEARAFYACQLMMETIHSETYSLLIAALIPSAEAQAELLAATETLPSVRAKAQWATRWMDSRRGFAHRLVAFACLEGVAFSAAFASIFWIKHRGYGLPGLCLSNEFIARDEALHTDFACRLYGKLGQRLSDKEAQSVVQGCVEVERQFVEDALPEGMVGMNAKQLLQYVRFCADRLLGALGHKQLYGATNPFRWMEQMSIGSTGKTNFFERQVSEYRLPGVGSSGADQVVCMDADF